MTNIQLRACLGEQEYSRLTDVWQSAVTATHDFLQPSDIAYYRSQMPVYLAMVDLRVATVDSLAVGFSGVADGKLEMLFIHDDFRGKGIGTLLIDDVVHRFPHVTLDVNEQNPAAVAFYRSRGFVVTGRMDTDHEGRPFPLLQMAYSATDDGARNATQNGAGSSPGS